MLQVKSETWRIIMISLLASGAFAIVLPACAWMIPPQAFFILQIILCALPAATATLVLRSVLRNKLSALLGAIVLLVLAADQFTNLLLPFGDRHLWPVIIMTLSPIVATICLTIAARKPGIVMRMLESVFVLVWFITWGLNANTIALRISSPDTPAHYCASDLHEIRWVVGEYTKRYGHPPITMKDLYDSKLLDEGMLRASPYGELFALNKFGKTRKPRPVLMYICRDQNGYGAVIVLYSDDKIKEYNEIKRREWYVNLRR